MDSFETGIIAGFTKPGIFPGLKQTGFGVKDKAVQYKPCQLMLSFREHLHGFPLLEGTTSSDQGNADLPTNVSVKSNIGREQPHIYLVVTVNPISSAYTCKKPMQIFLQPYLNYIS